MQYTAITCVHMAKIKISLSGGEITIEFTDTKDLEEQLQKIDLAKIDALLDVKKQNSPNGADLKETDGKTDSKSVKELGTINLLNVSGGGQDAVKLAVFLAANGMSREEIKKITGITILSS